MKTTLKQVLNNFDRSVEAKIRPLVPKNTKWKHGIVERQTSSMGMQLADAIFTSSHEAIMITDAQGTILKVNAAFTNVTGYTAEECLGKNPRILKSGKHDPSFYEEMWQSLREQGSWENEIWDRRKNNEAYLQWLIITAIKNEHNETTHYVAVFHDIMYSKRHQNQVAYQADHDVLTGLPNRQLFLDHLEIALADAQRHQHKVGVMFLDLDRFKDVNDSLGYNVGDLLLQEAAKRLKTCCRNTDTVARLSGDAFMMLLPQIKKDGEDIVEVARRIIKSFSRPFFLDDHEIMTTVSMGITIYPTDGEDVITLEKNADIAVHRAKEQGRNTYIFYTKAMQKKIIERVGLEQNLRKALQNEEFKVLYQPQFDIKTGIISGVEALVRWQRSARELVAPDRFIPLAEDTGLIFALGAWVLRTACHQTKAWHDAGFNWLSVAVNLSAKQFQDRYLVELVKQVLEETQLPPEFLYLEITENIAMQNIGKTVKMMSEIGKLGVHFSIDDFGTGYSSLGYLKQFPLHELKIDKSFVRELPFHHDDVAIAKAILSLAHNLNLTVLAEGIETQDQLEFMRCNECDEVQGFLFSKPIQPEALTVLLQQGKNFRM